MIGIVGTIGMIGLLACGGAIASAVIAAISVVVTVVTTAVTTTQANGKASDAATTAEARQRAQQAGLRVTERKQADATRQMAAAGVLIARIDMRDIKYKTSALEKEIAADGHTDPVPTSRVNRGTYHMGSPAV